MYATQSVHILVLYSDPIVAAGLSAVLGRQPDMLVVLPPGDHEAPESTDEFIAHARVDVALCDYESGLRYLEQAKAANRFRGGTVPKVLVFTQMSREWEVQFAIRSGVHGYVLQGCSLEELVVGVRALKRGARYFCEPVAERMADSMTRETLTARETEVLELLTKGYCNKTIAKHLCIAIDTVKTHVRRVLDKLDATTRAQAVAVATKRGLVPRAPDSLEVRGRSFMDELVPHTSARRSSGSEQWLSADAAA